MTLSDAHFMLLLSAHFMVTCTVERFVRFMVECEAQDEHLVILFQITC